ncbi:SAG-related sequence SRS16A [Besnoitia besnoiti]|uniref:SAG-related sequence SRS16A n=1 Tax=Besnoitia besnoiti TaxID=94643 RepID=A0A2A9MG67_BESBE|nr:SAG-related sequence SRS16A [Besnoitia besnoiti]PFH36164.1 SAG-related sequence SRS16A [Besnoitia besnoiti]
MAKKGRWSHRRRAFGVKSRLLVVVCVGGMALLSTVQIAYGLVHRNLKSTEASPMQPQVATCSLISDSNQGEPSPPSVQLSKDKLSAELQCTGQGNQVVPQTTTSVCKAVRDDLTVSECAKGNGNVITLSELLESDSSLEWTLHSLSADSTEKGQGWSLELQESHLPFSDKTFFVGCKKQPGDEDKSACKLIVSVKARASSAEKNVVTCAFGRDSNSDGPLNVELTKENNTLEMVCGKEGSFRPESYQTTFCQDADMKTCSTSYSEILPKFDRSWWAGGDKKTNKAKLTIPPTDFPAENHSFYVGCSAEKAAPETEEHVEARSDEPASRVSPCRVLVTVKAGGSFSFAQSRLQAAAAASGAAVVTAFLSGCL